MLLFNKKKKLSTQVIISFIIPVIIALLFLAYINYLNTKKLLLESNQVLTTYISDEIINILEFQELALNVLESNLDSLLREYSHQLVYDYFNETSNIENTDLDSIRNKLGLDPKLMDIYIIDKKGFVVNSTFTRDLNLNLFSFGEEHKKLLTEVFRQNKFVSERFGIESATRRIKKYTYQPTPDGKYIVELGAYSPKADDIIEFINQHLSEISRKKESILAVDLFISEDQPFSLNRNVSLNDEQYSLVKKVFNTNKDLTFLEKTDSTLHKYQFLYMKRKNTDLYKNSVIRIISDTSKDKSFLRRELIKLLIIFSFTILLVIFLLYRNAKAIVKPINHIAGKFVHIGDGHFNERIKIPDNYELATMSEQFNKMLDRVESNLEKLANEKEKAQIAQKLAESSDRMKSAFLANVSHEIRTPLNAVIGFAELLNSQTGSDEQHRYARAIIQDGKKLLELVNDILYLSKLEAGEVEVNISQMYLIDTFNDIYSNYIETVERQNIKFDIDIGKNVPGIILTDGEKLQKIIKVFLDNAIKFTEKGKITIKVYTENSSVPKQESSEIDLYISVQDTGIGIPKSVKQKIFKAFQQYEQSIDARKFAGTGVGLTIAKMLARLIHGRIMVDSETGKGSTFTIALENCKAIYQDDGMEPGKQTEKIPVDKFINKKILIIDDILENIEVLSGFLKGLKINCYKSDSGAEGINIAKKIVPDGIFLDLKMPGMNGFETIATLKAQDELRHIPIIAMTALTDKENKDLVKSAGFDGCLFKPIKKKQILSSLSRIVHLLEEHNRKFKSPESPVKSKILKKEELLNRMKNELIPEWENISQNLMVNDVENFASKCLLIAEEHAYFEMKSWASKLIEQTQSFDVENFPETLDYFAKLAEKIN